jgi:hypothetical protein
VLRLYCLQWLPFHTSCAVGQAGRQECEEVFRDRYQGRIKDLGWRIEATEHDYGRSFLLLEVPNCCGEYTQAADAERQAGEHGKHGKHPHQIVERGSREERELLAYGTRRLQGE